MLSLQFLQNTWNNFESNFHNNFHNSHHSINRNFHNKLSIKFHHTFHNNKYIWNILYMIQDKEYSISHLYNSSKSNYNHNRIQDKDKYNLLNSLAVLLHHPILNYDRKYGRVSTFHHKDSKIDTHKGKLCDCSR